MKNLKKTISAAIFTGLAMTMTAVMPAQAEVLKVAVGAEPYPPMYYPDASGQWHGFEVDLAGLLCKTAGLECVTTPIAWDGIIPALTSGKIDMIMGSMSITAERQKKIDFSDKYYSIPPMIIGTKDIKFEPTAEGMADKTVGVQVSTIHQSYIEKHFVPNGTTLKEYQTQDEANNDLAAGRLDAVMADAGAMADFLKTDAGQACCDAKGNPAPDIEILGPGVGIGLRKGDDALREKMNAAIKTVRENGEYETLAKKYFPYDVFGD
jgi:polar amino acid transport system substrate-binding protein